MPNLNALSLSRLGTCHPDLKRLILEVSSQTPIVVICGHRTESEQNAAYGTGHSRLQWPLSRHNTYPSRAVDIAPAPLDWDNVARFRALAALVKAEAEAMGIPVRWGGDFESIKDYAHFQI